MDAITLSLVNFFREDLEAAIKKIESLERQNMRLLQTKLELQSSLHAVLEDYYTLERQLERAEDFAAEQEQRANAYRDVMDGFIEMSSEGVRRDLLDEFNRVAGELDVDMSILNDFDVDSLHSGGSEDLTGLDEFFTA